MPTAHFLMKVVFCFFAEDTGLLPSGLFTRAIDAAIRDPEAFPKRGQPALRHHGRRRRLRRAHDPLLQRRPLPRQTRRRLPEPGRTPRPPRRRRQRLERRRSVHLRHPLRTSPRPRQTCQIGAHYTSEHDIGLVIDPVIMAPLRRQWDALPSRASTADAVQAASEEDKGKREVLGAPASSSHFAGFANISAA